MHLGCSLVLSHDLAISLALELQPFEEVSIHSAHSASIAGRSMKTCLEVRTSGRPEHSFPPNLQRGFTSSTALISFPQPSH